MMQSKPSLSSISKVLKNEAMFYFNSRFIVLVVAFILALIMLVNNDILYIILFLVALVIEIYVWWFHKKGNEYYRSSREAAKLALLKNSLGKQSGEFNVYIEKSIKDFYGKFKSKKLIQKAEQLDKDYEKNPYFASNKFPSNLRFLENLHENAFFSGNLCQMSVNWEHKVHKQDLQIFSVLFSMFFLFIILAIYWNQSLPTWSVAIIFKIIMVFYTIVIYGELMAISSWETTSDVCHKVEQRLDEIRKNKLSNSKDELNLDILLAALGDYEAAMVNAPPIPKHIWDLNRENLNRQWEERQNSYKSEV